MLIIALAMVILFAQGVSPANSVVPPWHATDLVATAIGLHQIDLTWTDNSVREDAYLVQRAEGAGPFADLATLGANATSYSDTSADCATTYSYRVYAMLEGVKSASSNVATATTPTDIPPWHATDLVATATGLYQIDLTWTDNSVRETSYLVQRAEGAGPFADLAILPADSNSYSDTSADCATTYSYRVYAVNCGGNSASSNIATATTPTDIPPWNATDLVATAAGPTEVNLTWTDNSVRETSYVVERAEGAGAFAEIATLAANSNSYSDTNVSTGITYRYRVYAVNCGDKSASSNIAEVTTP